MCQNGTKNIQLADKLEEVIPMFQNITKTSTKKPT